jgi:hypothetical protein
MSLAIKTDIYQKEVESTNRSHAGLVTSCRGRHWQQFSV